MGETGVKMAALAAGLAAAAAAACAPMLESQEAQSAAEPAPIESGFADEAVRPTSAPASDACDAQDHQALMGMTFDEARGSDLLPRRVRFICWDEGADGPCRVTADYVADRLNLYLDADGRVNRITCG